MQEEQSPSWFNPVEAVQVMKYLKAITSNQQHQLSFDDIGIITPYRKQVGLFPVSIVASSCSILHVSSKNRERFVVLSNVCDAYYSKISNSLDIVHYHTCLRFPFPDTKDVLMVEQTGKVGHSY